MKHSTDFKIKVIQFVSENGNCTAAKMFDIVFSSIVRDFLELFYNLWRTVLAKNKIVLDPALRLQSFRTPKTQQLVSEVGLNANNKSDGGPVPDSSRKKLTASMNAIMGEMKSELTASMNANMGEMKSELTHECQYRNEKCQ
ncbi:hypothetical protein TNCV_1978491 [Trichonephila clavipes]|nr:hypothetical protein TNCV_1978491 [Trichonephila clavipes]